MKAARLLVILVIGVALLGGAYLMRQQRTATPLVDAVAVQAEAQEMVMSSDAARRGDREYVLKLFQGATQPAVAAAGGAQLDEERYYSELFRGMVAQARADGKPEVAVNLRAFATGRKIYFEEAK